MIPEPADFSAETEWRERYGYDRPLPERLRCEACGTRVWGARGAAAHRRHCKGPVPDCPAMPPGPVWVDV